MRPVQKRKNLKVMPPTDQLPWRCRDRVMVTGNKTRIMGILNVTPDSFSDGGEYTDPDAAVARALGMLAYGADMIDVGGESTRPGADAVPPDEECRRVVPVIRALRRQSDCLISVDTMKAVVARQALEAGADIVNDVSALSADPEMPAVVREFGAGAVLMHMRGTPRTMQQNPQYDDVVRDVVDYLERRLFFCVQHGIAHEQLALDPGIGFGKTVQHNVQLLAGLPAAVRLRRPLLVGLSRKSFLGQLTGREVEDRLAASLAGLVCAIERGAHILRVHDVKESCDARVIADTMRAAQQDCD
jgi:dihydropteroate synthase